MSSYHVEDILKQAKDNAVMYKDFKNYIKFDSFQKEELYRKARETRDKHFSNKLFVRASMEFSNVCLNECKYCGMTKKNKNLERYTIPNEIIKENILQIKELGIKQLHLVSGENNELDVDKLCDVIKFATDNSINTTLVLGKKNREDYEKFYKAGARRYIIKFETSNPKLFKEYKNSLLTERIEQLYVLREIGFKIGTGIIYDLPNSTIEDAMNDLSLLNTIKPDMASASAFSPNAESELAGYKHGDVEQTLLFIAYLRIILGKYTPTISCSSSLGTEGQYKALMAGANVISYHITPKEFIDDFSIYKSSNRIKTKMEAIRDVAKRCNMEISEYI